MALINTELPSSFENEVIQTDSEKTVLRSNLKNISDVKAWIAEYGRNTNTKWNLRHSNPFGVRFVCCHKYVCHHSSFNKVPSSENKRGNSKNSNCPATITIKVKLDTKMVRKRDEYAKRGLFAVICKSETHNHSLETSESLRFLPSDECRDTFVEYFNDGMGVAESCKYHENILLMQENFTIEMLANSRINPTYRTVRHWFDVWRLKNLGPRIGSGRIQKVVPSSQQACEHLQVSLDPKICSLVQNHVPSDLLDSENEQNLSPVIKPEPLSDTETQKANGFEISDSSNDSCMSPSLGNLEIVIKQEIEDEDS